jgi:hypothetical protein
VRYATEALILALIPEIPGYNTGLPKEEPFVSISYEPADHTSTIERSHSQQLSTSSAATTVVVGLETDPAKVDERFQNIYRHLLSLLAPARNHTVGTYLILPLLFSSSFSFFSSPLLFIRAALEQKCSV